MRIVGKARVVCSSFLWLFCEFIKRINNLISLNMCQKHCFGLCGSRKITKQTEKSTKTFHFYCCVPLSNTSTNFKTMVLLTVSPTIRYDPEKNAIITFAGGCFWGTERLFKQFLGQGVDDLKVGYANGLDAAREKISYEEVCKGDTNYAEVVQLSYQKSDPEILEKLVEFFFKVHDPTQLNKQGEDNGTQYRSAIFYSDASQLETINRVIAEYNPKWDNKIVTVVEEIKRYYDAEDYHQNYFEGELHAQRQWPACETHFVRDI